MYISKIGKEDGKTSREEFGDFKGNSVLETLRGMQEVLQYGIGKKPNGKYAGKKQKH